MTTTDIDIEAIYAKRRRRAVAEDRARAMFLASRSKRRRNRQTAAMTPAQKIEAAGLTAEDINALLVERGEKCGAD